MTETPAPPFIQDLKDAFSLRDDLPFNALISQLLLMAENYERTISALPRFWQQHERTSCQERAHGIREAIAAVREFEKKIPRVKIL